MPTVTRAEFAELVRTAFADYAVASLPQTTQRAMEFVERCGPKHNSDCDARLAACVVNVTLTVLLYSCGFWSTRKQSRGALHQSE